MKSDSMTKFDYLYLGSHILDLFIVIAWWDFMVLDIRSQIAMDGGGPDAQLFVSELAPVLVGIGFAFSLLLWLLVSVFRIRFIRWVIALLVALSCIQVALGFGVVGADLLPQIIATISAVMTVASVYYVFRPDADAWLRYEA